MVLSNFGLPAPLPLSQQNQQLDLQGGGNAIIPRAFVVGVVFDPHRPYQNLRKEDF
jgi:hypothetical protein